MEFGELKTVLATLLLPPTGPLLLAFAGLWLARYHRRSGIVLSVLSLTLLWLLACHGFAAWLSRTALPAYPPLTLFRLKTSQAQAIVVLGGGVLPEAPEYGSAQPGPYTAARLRYGLWLARQSGLPVAMTGGMGWGAAGSQSETEAAVVARVAQQDYGVSLRWLESQSRDTAGNARLLAPLLQRDGVRRIALVTSAWHMARSVAAFERAGFVVTAAPTGFILPVQRGLLEWLPSPSGLGVSYGILREWLALKLSQAV